MRKRLLELYSTGTTVLHNEVVKSFWYICFNRIEKITPDAFESWMHILNQAPHSILVVFSQSQEIDYQLQVNYCVSTISYICNDENCFQMNARALGVEGSTRIVFLNRMPKLDYLRTLAVADLFLDTSHYGTTTPVIVQTECYEIDKLNDVMACELSNILTALCICICDRRSHHRIRCLVWKFANTNQTISFGKYLYGLLK